MRAIKWLLPFVKPYRLHLGLGIALDIIITLSALINPYVTGLVVEQVLQDGLHERLLPYLGVMVAVTFVRSGLRYAQLNLFEHASQYVLFNLRRALFERVHRQTYTFFDENRVGDIMARMTGDLDAIRHFIAYDVYAIPENILLFIAAMVMMFTLSPPLAASMLLIAPVIAVTAFKQSRQIKPAFMNVREQFSHLNSVCEENIGGNRVVKAFAQEDYEKKKFGEANQLFYESHMRTSAVWAKFLPVIEVCAQALPFLLLMFGSLLIIWGHMELWQLITFNGYLWMVNQPTRMFGNFVNDAQNSATSLDKIFSMMRKRVHIFSPGASVQTETDAPLPEEIAAQQARAAFRPAGGIKGAVEFKGVRFYYDRHNQAPLVLKDISFRVEPGQTVGLVGPTGSGKTTLALMIGRYYDVTAGQVLVDGTDVRDFDLQDLRGGIASAMQDVFLFSDTIEGNVAYGDPAMTMDTVTAAARAADADGFVRHMPEGYDTIVGERGVGLSGGQRQRLSLARALAVNPAILILDDTTSAVDMETEQRIQAALNELQEKKRRTTIIVAHRLLSVKKADLILVLQGGCVTERGTHDELMTLGGYYATQFLEQQGLAEGQQGLAEGQQGLAEGQQRLAEGTPPDSSLSEGGESHGA